MKVSVLDHGYVRRVDVVGSDLSIVNAARVSYDKESEEFSIRDEKLLAYLMREGHSSPFRHAAITFEAYAPLLVARQWWKYAVSSTHLDDQNGWNESSRRYITENETFYVPDKWEWRAAPENSKQGSDGNLDFVAEDEYEKMLLDDSVDWNPPRLGNYWTDKLMHMVRLGEFYYQEALRNNVAPEQARLFLPAYSLYVRWRWTVSLAGVMNFLDQRLEHDAQYEIQKYAQAVRDLTVGAFPKVMEARSNLKD